MLAVQFATSCTAMITDNLTEKMLPRNTFMGARTSTTRNGGLWDGATKVSIIREFHHDICGETDIEQISLKQRI